MNTEENDKQPEQETEQNQINFARETKLEQSELDLKLEQEQERVNFLCDLSEAELAFLAGYEGMSNEIYRVNKANGWWEEERNDGELLVLVHAEVSEAVEALRAGNPADDKIPEFSGVEAELADVIIRCMDMAEARGWNVGEAIIAKVRKNATRGHKHGGKKF